MAVGRGQGPRRGGSLPRPLRCARCGDAASAQIQIQSPLSFMAMGCYAWSDF